MFLASSEKLAEAVPKLAREYCRFIEKSLRGKVRLAELRPLLSACYLAFSCLKYTEDGGKYRAKSFKSTKIRQGLERLLKKQNYYYEVFNPLKKERPVTASLGDDLADIYVDLKEGLEMWSRRTKTSKIDALNVWHINFEVHTGNHIVSALRAVHWFVEQL